MTDYNKSVNFAVKDTLTSGDPNKIVSGAEIDTEFNNIASSSGTKADKVSAATANNFAGLNASGNLIDSGKKPSDFADATNTSNSISAIESDISDLETDISTKANKVLSSTEDNFASLDSNGDLKDSGQNQTTIINISSPTGAVTAFAATTPPSGWLECNGAAVSRTTYADLFSIIGTTFGLGDGTNTFNLPDLRGEFVRGWDNSKGIDIGRSFGSFQEATSFGEGGAFGETLQGSKNTDGTDGTASKRARQSSDENQTYTFQKVRPRNVALMYIIKT